MTTFVSGSSVILGLDPGSGLMGYGVVELQAGKFRPVDFGAVSTPAGWPLARRLLLLYQELCGIIARTDPQCVAVESLFFNVNARTALAVGQARGVALLSCAQSNREVFEYTPQQVKQGVVGYGRADKRQVQEMVRLLLKLDKIPRPDDAADALAVAICHANSLGFRGRLAAAEARGKRQTERRR